MSSTGNYRRQPSLSRRASRGATTTFSMEVFDNEVVPSSLQYDIAPILRVASEIQQERPRIAYLCTLDLSHLSSLPLFISQIGEILIEFMICSSFLCCEFRCSSSPCRSHVCLICPVSDHVSVISDYSFLFVFCYDLKKSKNIFLRNRSDEFFFTEHDIRSSSLPLQLLIRRVYTCVLMLLIHI